MIVFTDSAGKNHQIGSGPDMLKALGRDDRPMIYITDESGALVGAGVGIEGAQRSQPLIKALRNSQPMAKSFGETKKPVKTSRPNIFFKKSTGFSDQLNQLAGINRTLSDMRKAMNVDVSVSDDDAIDDDVWSVIANLDTRMAALETDVKKIAGFIASL